MLDMIGVGPFLTLPLMLAAMGGPQAMLGWILGALLALCDGLVWAELGAAVPQAGGSYAFLRFLYGGPTGEAKAGRLLSFLFLFQLLVSAPLSIASGAIGLARYAGYLWPGVGEQAQPGASHSFVLHADPETAIAIAAILLAVLLLSRGLAGLRIAGLCMWCAVMALAGWILLAGLLHGHLAQAFTFPAGAFQPSPAFFAGLGSAMLIATYDFWGYYNVTFLGAEVKDPTRNVPRAILISIGLVAALYVAMNVAVLAVLPWQAMVHASAFADARRAVVAAFMEAAYGPALGALAGRVAALLVIVAAFAGIFSLLLGYSRIPYAAALDGNFFRVFGRVHRRGFPHVSLFFLGAAAVCFCFFSLAQVIIALVVVRILLQFLLQHVGLLWLRHARPQSPRPFRMWLYPLPPLLAIAGFGYILVERIRSPQPLLVAAVVGALGVAAFFLRERVGRRSRPAAED